MAVLSLEAKNAREYMIEYAKKLSPYLRDRLLELIKNLHDEEIVDFVEMFKSVRSN